MNYWLARKIDNGCHFQTNPEDGAPRLDIYDRFGGSIVYTLWCGRGCTDWRVCRAHLLEDLEMLVRPVLNGGPQGKDLVEDVWFSETYPALFSWLTALQWPDGSEKQRSTITFFVEDGAFKVCLTNKDDQVSLWGSGDDLEGALKVLNARCVDPKAEWKKMGGWQKPRGRK